MDVEIVVMVMVIMSTTIIEPCIGRSSIARLDTGR
jgi:hypothetical protein